MDGAKIYCLVVFVVVSLLTKPPDPALIGRAWGDGDA